MNIKQIKMENNLISDPGPEVISLTVGEEFVEWAEKYWGLKRKYVTSSDEGDESCPYDYVKNTFARKIDEIIANRISKM